VTLKLPNATRRQHVRLTCACGSIWSASRNSAEACRVTTGKIQGHRGNCIVDQNDFEFSTAFCHRGSVKIRERDLRYLLVKEFVMKRLNIFIQHLPLTAQAAQRMPHASASTSGRPPRTTTSNKGSRRPDRRNQAGPGTTATRRKLTTRM
jgi:hypothetical protein